ncbi:hypothetical protein CYMTET_23192 [Cymbomonas tetramitiformis]|uniref:Cyclic nucleotide-binding domain-containing protein n=1 Tax=Cymbomonas tetramitiformis TaxID=36881 RepID=A0AAE0L1I9_9CHLO|nr:hypothetical protein CYMTET_23192 [Cymbomonas tetramitiformis]
MAEGEQKGAEGDDALQVPDVILLRGGKSEADDGEVVATPCEDRLDRDELIVEDTKEEPCALLEEVPVSTGDEDLTFSGVQQTLQENTTSLQRKGKAVPPPILLDPQVEQFLDLLEAVQGNSRFWRGFQRDELQIIAQKLQLVRRFTSGQHIVNAGQLADHVALLLCGTASIHARMNDGQSVHMASMRVGTLVGELSLYDGGYHSAHILAESDNTTVALFKFPSICELYLKNPKLGLKLLRTFTNAAVVKLNERKLLMHAKEQVLSFSVPIANAKLLHLLCEAQAVLTSSGFGKAFKKVDLEILSRHLTFLTYPNDAPIFLAGETAGHIFIVLSGRLEVREGNAAGKFVTMHGAGELIGSEAFMESTMAASQRATCLFAASEVTMACFSFQQLMKFNALSPITALKLLSRMGQVCSPAH